MHQLREKVYSTIDKIYLFSIKPLYAYKIFSRKKKFELRRELSEPIEDRSLVIVYASSPVQAIIGEFYVARVIRGDPSTVWKRVRQDPVSGISSSSWRYIRGAKKAIAIEVKNPILYPRRIYLEEIRRIIPGWNPPLSYRSLNTSDPLYKLIILKLRTS